MSRIVIKSILISEAVDPCCREVLQENGIRMTEKLNLSREDLISEIKVTMMNTLLLSVHTVRITLIHLILLQHNLNDDDYCYYDAFNHCSFVQTARCTHVKPLLSHMLSHHGHIQCSVLLNFEAYLPFTV